MLLWKEFAPETMRRFKPIMLWVARIMFVIILGIILDNSSAWFGLLYRRTWTPQSIFELWSIHARVPPPTTMTLFDSLFNLTRGPRSDETKRQICFLVHTFHSSDNATILLHRLSVDKRLFLPTLFPRIGCCEFLRYRFRLDHLLVTRSRNS